MSALNIRYPDHIPAPIAVDEAQRWMLLPDIGEPFWSASDDEMAATWRTLGQIQVGLANQIDDLIATGCQDRRLETLLAQIDPFLGDRQALSGLEDDEIMRIQALIPELKDRCHQLISFDLPASLVHGDLYKGNLAHKDGQTRIFDWAEGCITHPFFDLLEIYMAEDAVLQQHLRDSYLSVWVDHVSMTQLLEIWSMAEPLCALHVALSAHHIVTNVESAIQPQLAHNVPRWLRVLLKTMP